MFDDCLFPYNCRNTQNENGITRNKTYRANTVFKTKIGIKYENAGNEMPFVMFV